METTQIDERVAEEKKNRFSDRLVQSVKKLIIMKQRVCSSVDNQPKIDWGSSIEYDLQFITLSSLYLYILRKIELFRALKPCDPAIYYIYSGPHFDRVLNDLINIKSFLNDPLIEP